MLSAVPSAPSFALSGAVGAGTGVSSSSAALGTGAGVSSSATLGIGAGISSSAATLGTGAEVSSSAATLGTGRGVSSSAATLGIGAGIFSAAASEAKAPVAGSNSRHSRKTIIVQIVRLLIYILSSGRKIQIMVYIGLHITISVSCTLVKPRLYSLFLILSAYQKREEQAPLSAPSGASIRGSPRMGIGGIHSRR